MTKGQAKKEALLICASTIRVEVSANSWEEQGVLDEFSEQDQSKIYNAALEVADELVRRAARHD